MSSFALGVFVEGANRGHQRDCKSIEDDQAIVGLFAIEPGKIVGIQILSIECEEAGNRQIDLPKQTHHFHGNKQWN